MARIKFTETRFVKPSQISESEYYEIKNKISLNPNHEIAPDSKSPSRFDANFNAIAIGIGGGFVVVFIGAMLETYWIGSVFSFLGVLLLLFGVFSVIQIFLESPSYLKYKIDRQDYFFRMKKAIQNTTSYQEFLIEFY